MTHSTQTIAVVDPHSTKHMSHALAFWVVAAAFLTAMAFSVVPTPLWTLYRERDGFSTFAITVAFAAYALGVIVSLFLAGHLSDRLGRRPVLVVGLLVEALAAVLFIVWNDLAGLIVDRVISGAGIGIITATATAHIFELNTKARPTATRVRSDIVSTAANLGGFGVGALVSGVLAQYVALPLVTPYLVFLVLLVVGAIALAVVPETVETSRQSAPYRPQRVRVPSGARGTYFAAGAIALGSFSVLGLFTALAPVFIASDLGITSHAVAGLVVFATFAAAAVTQIVMRAMQASTQIAIGLLLMLLGLVGIVWGVFGVAPVLFILGGVLAGGGGGVLFRSAFGIGAQLAEARYRSEAIAGLFLFGYVGLSVPVLGIGVATLSIPLPDALLGFAILNAVIVIIASIALLRSSQKGSATRR